jgi:TatD DNase family protein
MENIFDSHAHYDDEAFDTDRLDVLAALPSQGICGVINCAGNKKSSKSCLELSEKFDFVFAACGIHPHSAGVLTTAEIDEDFHTFFSHKKCVAVGEIGLDYHYDFSPREVQKQVFEAQLRLAVSLHLPVVVHDREAHEDTLLMLKKYKPKGVVHCFSGSVEMADEIVKLGMYIGLGGAVTFKNARKPLEVARFMPAERLLIETDCPYMSPVPFRGTRCTSALIPYSAEKIAAERGITAQALLDITANNAEELFGIERYKK